MTTLGRRVAATGGLLALLSGVAPDAGARGIASTNVVTEVETARSQAFSGSGVSVGHDPTMVWINPAAIGTIDRASLTLAMQRGYFEETTGHAIVLAPHEGGVGAFGFAYSDAGTATLVGEETGERSVALQRDFLGTISYGFLPVPDVSVGVTVKGMRTELFEEFTASAFFADLGFQVQLFPLLKIGGAVGNAGPRFSYFEDMIDAPTCLRGGAALAIPLAEGDAALAMVDGEYRVVENQTDWKLAMEYQMRRTILLRAGACWNAVESLSRYTAGLGFVYDIYRIDYSLKMTRNFDVPQSLSLTVLF